MDHGFKLLPMSGAAEELFKVTLLKYGFTLVAKGTVTRKREKLVHRSRRV